MSELVEPRVRWKEDELGFLWSPSGETRKTRLVGLPWGISTVLCGGIGNVLDDRRDGLLCRYLNMAIPGKLMLVC
ncbi:hypothetical protein [Pseudomonas luteola]|uniref:hypothetical protein n=1 Tax=Pseudomonas luteola TaxID=47886 RepID=UPI00123A5608|nr:MULTISPECIES: hypothetical protein [Pseudomonas]MBA1246216.1 hypothetical protein [Pseudomonas zeshuii]QEU26920.1 hypothetical protein FOB45_03645 [Pseudomonas luteola]